MPGYYFLMKERIIKMICGFKRVGRCKNSNVIVFYGGQRKHMKINWKVRIQNKTWLLSMAAVLIAFVYQILALCGVLPPISEDTATQAVAMMINILVAFGIVVDPTTKGIRDSDQAMAYQVPAGTEQKKELVTEEDLAHKTNQE